MRVLILEIENRGRKADGNEAAEKGKRRWRSGAATATPGSLCSKFEIFSVSLGKFKIEANF